MDFVEVPGQNGQPALLNLSNTFIFQRTPEGGVVAVSIAGAAYPLEERWEKVVADATGEPGQEIPGLGSGAS
jgi:hypothetical protein